MNKIGIFGDSFAVPHVLTEWGNYERYMVSWIKLLEANSHAYGGSDVAYSFLKFEQHHSKYDQVIFVLTNPATRITVKHRHHLLNSTDKESSQRAIKRLKKSDDYDPKLHHIHLSLIEWHKMHNLDVFADRETLFCKLIVERIKQLRPDVKFIQAFSWNNSKSKLWYSEKKNQILPSTSCLIDITNYENKIFGWNTTADQHKWNCIDKKEDIRVGHITSESHIILAELIKKWLKTDEMFFDFDIEEFHNIKPDVKMYDTHFHNSYEDWLAYCKESENE
jgi:hypothetical protein